MLRRSHSARLAVLAAVAAVAGAGPALAQHKATARPEAPQQGGVVVPKAQKVFPTNVQWTLYSMGGRTFNTGERPSIMLDGQFRARGFGGCNNFSATAYPLQAQHFAVGPIAATKKACDKGVMETEKAFLVAFRTAQTWDVKDGYLIIQSAHGELKFQRSI